MFPLDPIVGAVVAALLLVLVTVLAWFWRRPPRRWSDAATGALPDTGAEGSTEALRVMSIHERRAHDLLRRALPGMLVLAQVPLARFLRPPPAHGHARWQREVGALSADLLLCDAGSRVLAVIDIRTARETERSRRRHEQLARALRGAGIRVYVWREGQPPTAAELRAGIGADLTASASWRNSAGRAGLPLMPAPESSEFDPGEDSGLEPVPSDFFDDSEPERDQFSKA